MENKQSKEWSRRDDNFIILMYNKMNPHDLSRHLKRTQKETEERIKELLLPPRTEFFHRVRCR